MAKFTAAGVQQQMRLFDSLDDYQRELNRFLYMARAKGAKLVVLPALSGVMAATPQVQGRGINLLRRAEDRSQKSLWGRTRGAVASRTATLLKADFRKGFIEMLKADPKTVRLNYTLLFSELAHAYGMTIVAGTAFLPDSAGTIRHRATVYGPDGSVLGFHDAVLLAEDDAVTAQPGVRWQTIDTPVCRLGIMLGAEVLYPEAGRLLVHQGADLLVMLAATASEAQAAYLRQGTIARVQENQIFGIASFLVGKNYLANAEEGTITFTGRSGIYAPLEMTPRYSGVLVEMGTTSSEGLLTADLDQDGLRSLWEDGTARVRRQIPKDLFARDLPAVYGGRQALTAPPILAEPAPVPQLPVASAPLPGVPGQREDLEPADETDATGEGSFVHYVPSEEDALDLGDWETEGGGSEENESPE